MVKRTVIIRWSFYPYSRVSPRIIYT